MLACVCKPGGKIRKRIEHSLMLAGLESMCEICWVQPSVAPYVAARWLDWTVLDQTTSAARQSPQHRMFRCERASPTSTPSFCSIRLVCVCWCWVKCCECMLMQLHVIYHLLSSHRPFTFCFPHPWPGPLHLYGWLAGYILWERWWWLVSCEGGVFTWTCPSW